MPSARVVGAGLSGLAAAWHLTEAKFDVEVVEAAPAPGGLIGTIRTPHGLVERAANAFRWTRTTSRWFQTLGITPVFPQAVSRRRFIFRNGKPRRWPLGPIESVGLASRALSALASRGLSPRAGESVAGWSDRVLGPLATEWLVGPALQGIYASPPDKLAAQSIIVMRKSERPEGQPHGMAAPSGGMGEFIEKLTAALVTRGVTFRFDTRLASLDPTVPTIVSTGCVPAADLIAPHAPELAAAIGGLGATSVATVTAFFTPHARDVRGFGILFPRPAGVRARGVLFNVDIFAGRSELRSETWIYTADDAAFRVASDDGVRSIVLQDRLVLTHRKDGPVAIYVTRQPSAIPVYGPGVLEIGQRLNDLPPWLALSGNYLGRIGVAALLDVAAEAAGRIAAPPSLRARG